MECSKCGQAIQEGAKFCPTCGTAVEALVKARCEACGHDLGDGAKFCDQCGETLAKALTPEDYDAAMGALEVMAKANTALGDDIDVEYEAEEEPVAPITAEAATGSDDEIVDAFPIVDALFKSQNCVVNTQSALAKELRAIRRDQGVLAKALHSEMAASRKLRETIEQTGKVSPGRRSVSREAQVEPLKKGVIGVSGNGGSDSGLKPYEIMAKALTFKKANPEAISAHDIARLNNWVNRGATVAQICKSDPGLAAVLPGIVSAN